MLDSEDLFDEDDLGLEEKQKATFLAIKIMDILEGVNTGIALEALEVCLEIVELIDEENDDDLIEACGINGHDYLS